MQLVIAEKPSVAKSIAKVIGARESKDGYMEGNGYIVSWCVGHLIGLASPDQYDEKYKKWRAEDLPILPENWKTNVAYDKKKQYSTLTKLMKRSDVTELICATDAGREGELIFRLVYYQAKCKKPFKRLWISSMEDEAIRDGFTNLKKGSTYDTLYEAALCRQRADWLVGMNGTRLFSTKYGTKLTVGRVQTPTLAMVVERQKQIIDFQKEKYFNVHLDCDNLVVHKEKIFDPEAAEQLRAACDGADVEVISVIQKEKSIAPPKLYDLTTVQREANRIYGYTAQKTLNTAQSLYEKKLITYPRTDSQFLTEDMEATANYMIDLIRKTFEFASSFFDGKTALDVQAVINNAKVTDHHAIIPTREIGKRDFYFLDIEERMLLMLVAQRLLAATAPRHRYMETEVLVRCGEEEFSAKGKEITDAGWKAIEEAFRKYAVPGKGEKQKEEAQILPSLREGQILHGVNATTTEHFTQPPKSYTEDTLLSSMETAGNDSFDEDTEKKGLGTPATRASMIEKLVASRYVERKGKQIIPTEAGMKLVAAMPEQIRSPKLTAQWENSLLQIEKGHLSPQDFMGNVVTMITNLVQDTRNI